MIDKTRNRKEFLGRVAIWTALGAMAGLRDERLAACALLGPVGEKALGFTLEDVLAAAEQERQRQLALQRLNDLWAALGQAAPNTQQEVAFSSTGVDSEAAPSTIVSPQGNFSPVPTETDAVWRQKVVHPSVVLVVGKRGSGKSALGYRLLELFRYKAQPFVVGVPESARSLLPDWLGIAPTLEEVPVKSIALVDEAYLRYHARGSMAKESKMMSQALNLSRQREQTIIFITQEARQVDRNIASSANVVVFKDLGMLQLEFDRPELNKLATQARAAFTSVKGDKRRWSFVYAPDSDFLGLLEDELPSFWTPRLSHVFAAGGEASATKLPEKMSLEERIQKAKQLRAQGASYKEIAQTLGVTRGTALNYIRGYPYRN